jgi:hypothetical protein
MPIPTKGSDRGRDDDLLKTRPMRAAEIAFNSDRQQGATEPFIGMAPRD